MDKGVVGGILLPWRLIAVSYRVIKSLSAMDELGLRDGGAVFGRGQNC